MAKYKGKTVRLRDLSLPDEEKFSVGELAATLSEQAAKEIFEERYAKVSSVLKFVGAGLFLGAAVMAPGLAKFAPSVKDLINEKEDHESWKRFNIPYLKRTLERLERQKLVVFKEKDGKEIVEITKDGKRKILKFALEELKIEKPRQWNGKWWLVSYDIPEILHGMTNYFRSYLIAWGFYPFQESVFLHAYPCRKQVEFLREYLGIGDHVRILEVDAIENDKIFRSFFGV